MPWLIKSFAFAVLVVGNLQALATAAMACGFHIAAPPNTVVQDLIDADEALLLGYDPGAPQSLRLVERLKGKSSDVPDERLDPLTKRLLLAQWRIDRSSPDTLLFVRPNGDATWQRIAYVEHEERWIVDTILINSASWTADQTGELRFRFFETLLLDRDPDVRGWALSELDRTPYSLLRTLGSPPSISSLMRDIKVPLETHFSAVRIMMLGLHEENDARSYIRQQIESAKTRPDPLLGAWIVALLEAEGTGAFDFLIAQALEPSSSFSEALFAALALHSAHGNPDLRHAFSDFAMEAITIDPSILPIAVSAFWNQKEYTLAPKIIRAFEPQSVQEALAIAGYLQAAQNGVEQ